MANEGSASLLEVCGYEAPGCDQVLGIRATSIFALTKFIQVFVSVPPQAQTLAQSSSSSGCFASNDAVTLRPVATETFLHQYGKKLRW